VIPVLFDENFDQRIVRGLERLDPQLDGLTARAAGLEKADDPRVLEWAASRARVVITHDVNTMVHFAKLRLGEGLPMSGLILIPDRMAVGQAIEELQIVIECSQPGERNGTILFLPL
jgi:predicted nuclease of predicted toxin-antitoxin system